MREIKFRGKRIDTVEWVYGDLIENQGRYYIYYATSDTTLENEDDTIIVLAEEVDPDTVGQYTGLKDRNGKDVWEGDLLSSDGIVCEVAYDEYLASFHLIIDKIKGRVPLGDMMRSFEFQVIGNRWDNPELLEDGK